MANVSVSFDITDTANNACEPTTLEGEISADSEITISLAYVELALDGLSFLCWFHAALPAADETALGARVALHEGLALEEPVNVVQIEPDPIAGMPVFQPLAIRSSATDKHREWQTVAPPKTIVNTDILVSDKLTGPKGLLLLSGGEYECRTAAAHGSALHLALVDRDDYTGMFGLLGMSRTQAVLSSVQGQGIVAGHVLVGDSSGAQSEVLAVIDANNVEITFESGEKNGFELVWEEGESITVMDAAGDPTGGTCVLDDWIEGGIFELMRPVENEWVEGYRTKKFAPGGASEIPQGLYLRVITYNNHERDDLRMVIGLQLGLD